MKRRLNALKSQARDYVSGLTHGFIARRPEPACSAAYRIGYRHGRVAYRAVTDFLVGRNDFAW